jgi:hypothetical protein
MSDYESQARGWLESVDAPPSRLEVTGIVLTGRARARRRRYLAAGGAAGMVLAVAAALPVAVDGWQAAPRGGGESPTGLPYVTVAGITDGGVVVATVGAAGGDEGGHVWGVDRVGHRLPLPAGATGGYVAAARGGWAAGAAYLPAPEEGLPPTPIEDGAGQVVTGVPVRWNLDDGTVELIESYAGWGTATAVTGTGDLLLGSTLPDPGIGNSDPVVLRDGLPYTLPVPVEGGRPQPVAVSADGTVFAGAVATDAPGGGDPVVRPTVWHCR